jgi:glyoxylase-like metal-dependent hydrolase (beta-lactamase superfamily II)
MLMWKTHDFGPGIILKAAVVGFAEANCYILACAKKLRGVIIDPGTDVRDEWTAIVDEALKHSLKIDRILNTHGHPDHFFAGPSGRRWPSASTTASS